MAEFHEVGCPDDIGRETGYGKNANSQIK